MAKWKPDFSKPDPWEDVPDDYEGYVPEGHPRVPSQVSNKLDTEPPIVPTLTQPVPSEKTYASDTQFSILMDRKRKGTLNTAPLTSDIWLLPEQAKTLGYNKGEADFQLSPTKVDKPTLAPTIQGQAVKQTLPTIVSPSGVGKPPLAQPQTTPTFQVPPEAGGSIRNVLLRLYGNEYAPQAGGQDIEAFIRTKLGEQMETDPEGFISSLISKNLPNETRALLQYFGLPDEAINEIVGAAGVRPQIQMTLNKIPVFSGFGTDDVLDMLENDPQGFVRLIRTGSLTPEKQELLKLLNISQMDLASVAQTGNIESQLKAGGVSPDEIKKIAELSKRDNMTDEDWLQEYRKGLKERGDTFNFWHTSLAMRSIHTTIGGMVESAAGVASWAKQDKISNNLRDIAGVLQKTSPEFVQWHGVDSLVDPRFWATSGVGAVTSAVTLLPAALLAFVATPSVGVSVAGAIAVKFLFGAAGAIPEASVEAGAAYNRAKASGMTDEEASDVANKVFWANEGLLAFSNTVTFGFSFGKTPFKKPLNNLLTKGLVKISVQTGIPTLTEGGQEVFQSLVSKIALGEKFEWNEETKTEFVLGAIMGGVMGGSGAILTSIQNKAISQMTPEMKQDYTEEKSNLIKKGLPEDKAAFKALDVIAKTEEGKTIIENATEAANKEELAKLIKDEEVKAEVKKQVDDLTKPSAEKEPWQMTQGEFDKQLKDYDLTQKAQSYQKTKMTKDDILDKEGNVVSDIYHREFKIIQKGKKTPTYTIYDTRQQSTGFYSPSQSFTSKNLDEVIGWANKQIKQRTEMGTFYPEKVGSYYLDPEASHKEYIQSALSEGKPVPASVLADYPDLAKQAPPGGKGAAQAAQSTGEQAVAEPETQEGAPPQKPPDEVITETAGEPDVPRDSEIKRLRTLASEQVRQDKPKTLTRIIRRIPGLRTLAEFERPGLKMGGENQSILEAIVVEEMARADVSVKAVSTRLPLLRELRDTFTKDVLRGGKSDIEFVGTPEQAKNPLTGTLLDIVQNPELYKLTDNQLAVIARIEAHNDALLNNIVNNYGADVGRFRSKPDGAFLPNVDISEDVIQWLETETRAVATGMGKARVWQTARDRIEGQTSFSPELNVQKLIEGLDTWKASVAAGQTFRATVGGLTRLEAMEQTHPALYKKMLDLRKKLQKLQGYKRVLESQQSDAIERFLVSGYEDSDIQTLRDSLELEAGRFVARAQAGKDIETIKSEIAEVRQELAELRPAWKSANLKPYVMVQEGIFRYFPAEQAKLIVESRATTKNGLLGFIEAWRGQAFSGDLSPFTIQGIIGVLADPYGSLQAGLGGVKSAIKHRDIFRSVSVEALADDIASNPTEWGEYASLMGRNLTGTPKEYAAGFLSKIKGFDTFTESTYVTITRGSFNLWQRNYKNMVKHGVPVLEAKIAAADIASKVYPLVSQTRLGQSQKRHAVLRALPTSYSFIRQPLTLTSDAVRGMAKLATLQKLTPAESLAVKIAITGAASTLAVSATSAFLSVKAQGGDDDDAWQAVLDAINPHPMNGKFASIIIGNVRIPLGGAYRALFRAVYPSYLKGVPFPVPFAGVPNYIKNRITPALRTQLDLLVNKDYSGAQIVKGNFPENIIRMLEYEFENFLPLTVGAAIEGVRQGDRLKEPLWQQVIGSFMGVNPVTLDNTYIDRQIRQLGLQKEGEAKPFELNKVEYYTTKDLYGDVSSVLKKRISEGFKDKPLTIAVKETMAMKETSDNLLNNKLSSISDDEWELLQKRFDLDDTAEFDKAHPDLANISKRDFLLLSEYKSLTDKKAQAQFLKDHPELSKNPRQDWLKANPKENAYLALFGQAKVLTKEAYNEVQRLIKELDIPDSAVPDLQIPKDSVDDYFTYQDMVAEGKHGSWEAQLMLKKNDSLRKFLNLKPNETPLASLELKVKNRANFDKLEAFSDESSPDYIKDEKVRAEAVKKFKESNPSFVDDMRRIEAIEKGTDTKPVSDSLIKAHVDFGKLQDEDGVGSSSAVSMLYRVDNPEYDKWRQDKNIWGDNALKPIDQTMINRWRFDVKYQKEDAEYDAIKATLPAEQARLRAEYLKAHPEYADDRRRREAITLSNSKTGYKLPEGHIENYVKYNSIPLKGKRRDRFLIDNPDFAISMLQSGALTTIPKKVPDVGYDDVYDMYPDKFDAYDEATTDEDREALVKTGGQYNDFGLAKLRRDAFFKYVPNNHVDTYVRYYEITGEGKGKDYEKTNKTDLWFEDDWYLIENPTFYKEVYIGLFGNKPKDFRKVPLTIDGKPDRTVFAKYLQYLKEPTDYYKDQYRLANSDLDEWGVNAGIWSKSIKEQKTKSNASTRDTFWFNIGKSQKEFEESLK